MPTSSAKGMSVDDLLGAGFMDNDDDEDEVDTLLCHSELWLIYYLRKWMNPPSHLDQTWILKQKAKTTLTTIPSLQ